MPDHFKGDNLPRREPKTVKEMDARTPEESQPETDDDILRSLGWWLIPSNGDGPEVKD